jgi:hypothetical protein
MKINYCDSCGKKFIANTKVLIISKQSFLAEYEVCETCANEIFQIFREARIENLKRCSKLKEFTKELKKGYTEFQSLEMETPKMKNLSKDFFKNINKGFKKKKEMQITTEATKEC